MEFVSLNKLEANLQTVISVSIQFHFYLLGF